jgi:hypothetical protein
LAAETGNEHLEDVFCALFANGKELDYVLGVIPATHPEWSALAKDVHINQGVTRQGLDEERPNYDQLISTVEEGALRLFREQLDNEASSEALARTWMQVMGDLRHVGPRRTQVIQSIFRLFPDRRDNRRLKKGWKKVKDVLSARSGS